MNKAALLRGVVCIFILSLFLYFYTDHENSVTQLRISLPVLSKEIKMIEEENRRLKYLIEEFENPEHLMQLASLKEYSHLAYPLFKDVLQCETGLALETKQLEEQEKVPNTFKVKPTLVIGAAP